MRKMEWQGVIPAITTPFNEDLSVDHGFLAKHCKWMVDSGCKGVVALGSLGEGGTLSFAEKMDVLRTCLAAVGDQAFVVAGISAVGTTDAIAIAKEAEKMGCHGLMVLPPYVYIGDWRETEYHISAVVSSVSISCMLYNNPVAYTTDFLPEHVVALLAAHPNLHAIKESSTDVRRVMALRAVAGDRLQIAVGVDDAIVEAVYVGATGWIAGLVNAFPRESVKLFELAMAGKKDEAFALYSWFLPLLRMDTVPKFVQLIKLVQERVGMGNQRVRAPRLTLVGAELAAAENVISESLKTRPAW